jgi:Zn-dependent protease
LHYRPEAEISQSPGIVINRLIGATPAQLFESHRQKIAELPINNPAKSVRSAEELDTMYDRYEKLAFDFNVQRGLYVPMSDAEVAAEQQIVTGAKAMAVAGTEEHADVLVQLSALQNQKPGWSSAFWILILSLLGFVAAGSRQWSWSYVLILVPVLFIHELGHFLAMRAFHYRNLRMFFIPFFGAAVAGRHYNVPGWKKVVVSLMGPVPGILLGAVVGGLGFALNSALLTRIALVLLILNGSNLVPLLPLDGGWVFHALFFCRHYLLDSAFRVVAALGLFGGGLLLHSKILTYLGIPMLLSIPISFRMARIAAELKKRGLPPVSPDDQNIPPETARAIITELKKATPGKQSTKMLAQQTLQIFETLNARPPGWAATGGLLLGHLASIATAGILVILIIAARQSRLFEPFSAVTRQPTRSFICGGVASWSGAQADSNASNPRTTIIGHFSTRNAAQMAFQWLTNRVPASTTLKTFGNSIFLGMPAADQGVTKQWLAEMQRQTKSVFVVTSNAPAMLSVIALFPGEAQAQAAEQELKEYFSVPESQGLIPPWYPQDPRTDAERAAHDLARQSYLKAENEVSESYEEPAITELHKQIADAALKGQKPEMETLENKVRLVSLESARKRLEQMKTTEAGSVDPATLDLYAALLASRLSTNREQSDQALLALSERMGRLPKVGENGAADERFSLGGGLVSTEGRKLELTWATPKEISEGAPALLDWLCARGGAGLRYEIIPTPNWLRETEEKE